MLNSLKVSYRCPLEFLQQYPPLLDSLLGDCNYDLDEVAAIASPLVNASERCCHAPHYIQAISTGRTRFLATNLTRSDMEIIPIASTWLIGRSSVCAIVVSEQSVSRCHAIIGYHSAYGFYITDIGSSNGTKVNGRALRPTERRKLQDGDLIHMGRLKVEFFASRYSGSIVDQEETASLELNTK